MRRFPITRKVEHEDILDLVRRAGRALHGERWQVPLSRDLGVSDRALRYWIDGTYAVPVAEVLPRLLEILQGHEEEVAKVKTDILNAIIS